MWSSLVLGFGLGFLVGFQLGPMSAWLIRTTLRSGYGAGAAIAAGVGVVDLCYAGIGVTGVATALRSDNLRTVPKAATWRPWSWASVSAVSAGW